MFSSSSLSALPPSFDLSITSSAPYRNKSLAPSSHLALFLSSFLSFSFALLFVLARSHSSSRLSTCWSISHFPPLLHPVSSTFFRALLRLLPLPAFLGFSGAAVPRHTSSFRFVLPLSSPSQPVFHRLLIKSFQLSFLFLSGAVCERSSQPNCSLASGVVRNNYEW